jgi:hypothetical protein
MKKRFRENRPAVFSLCLFYTNFLYRVAHWLFTNSNFVSIPKRDSEWPINRKDFEAMESQNRFITAVWAASSK